MKAAIVLLADHTVQNLARRMVFELEQKYQIDFLASLLPAHVSLKQPFTFEDMAVLEGYFDSLAAQIAPFPIELDELYCAEWAGYGILGMNVQETSALRNLHDRLNHELSQLFQDASAAHDGETYHFHLTIELGKVGETNPYQEYFDQLPDKKLNLSFLAQEIALFYYTGADHQSFITYKVLPLQGFA